MIYNIIIVTTISGYFLFLYWKAEKRIARLNNKNKEAINDIEQLKLKIRSLETRNSQLEKKQSEQMTHTLEQSKLSEKNKKIWAMSEAVYKEKKKVDEELEKLNIEKENLEAAKNKLDDKVKKLWQTSTAVHKEKERINALKQEIELKHREIVDSVTYAQRIQEAILPDKNEIKRLPIENFILFQPRDIVSGDFYWFSVKENQIIIACVDCTGHGVPGAFMSMIGNTLLNQIVNEKDIHIPAQILTLLNQEITRALKQDAMGSDSRDGMDISICKINFNEKELEYAGANRPLYFIRNRELQETKANKISIGGHMHEEEKIFTNHHFQLQPGDTFYLSTDGFADQFSPADKKLMTKRFKEILLNIQELSMAEQENHLRHFLNQWKQNTEQTDDILVMGIRLN